MVSAEGFWVHNLAHILGAFSGAVGTVVQAWASGASVRIVKLEAVPQSATFRVLCVFLGVELFGTPSVRAWFYGMLAQYYLRLLGCRNSATGFIGSSFGMDFQHIGLVTWQSYE